MAVDKTVGELTESTLTTGDYVPSERASSNYKLNLRSSITGVFNDSFNNVKIGLNTITGFLAGENNIAVGQDALKNIQYGFDNIAIGEGSLKSMVGGYDNVAIGERTATAMISGNGNVIIGDIAASALSGINNSVLVGKSAGGSAAGNPWPGDQCVLLGSSTRPSGSGDVNSIVIGYLASGAGSNTAVIGNTSITNTYLFGSLNLSPSLSIYNGGTNATTATGAMVNLAGAAGLNYVYAYDEFLSPATSSTTIGTLGWGSAGSVSIRGHELNHPGIFRFTSTSPTLASLFANYLATANGMSAFSGLNIEAVFRLDSITNSVASFGLGYVNSPVTTNGARVLYFDTGVSANWQLLHRTQAGATTYVNTTKPVVANDWVKTKLYFSGDTTYCNISTTSSPAEVSVSNAGASTHSTLAHCPQFLITSSSSTKSMDVDAFLMHGVVSRL